MAKEKVTLTLDADDVAELRHLVGARSLSAGVSDAVAARLVQLRHQIAIDNWLAELDGTHGPVPEHIRAWGVEQVERWAAKADPQRQAG